MAIIPFTMTKLADGGSNTVYLVTWAAMGNADTGTPVAMSGSPDRSVQIEGTFASATVVMQGSNDGTNYQSLTDPQGNAISKTASGLEQIEELTRFVRPSTSGGAGTSVTVSLILRGQP